MPLCVTELHSCHKLLCNTPFEYMVNSRTLTEYSLQSVRSESQSTLAILTSVRPGNSFLDRSSHTGARFLQWPHLQERVGEWVTTIGDWCRKRVQTLGRWQFDTFKYLLHISSWDDPTMERRIWQKSGPWQLSLRSCHLSGSITWTAKRKESLY